MDESTQQAINLGINLTLFVLALTITITLMMNVKDISEKASEFNAALPNGSRTISVENQNVRVIEGHELISYYANYLTDINNNEVYLAFEVIIQNSSAENKIVGINKKLEEKEFAEFFKESGVDLNKSYEVIVQKYDNENKFLTVILREIE